MCQLLIILESSTHAKKAHGPSHTHVLAHVKILRKLLKEISIILVDEMPHTLPNGCVPDHVASKKCFLSVLVVVHELVELDMAV